MRFAKANQARERKTLLADLLLAFCVIVLFGVQALHTQAYWYLLRLEDAAETLRAPYWLAARRTIYNGVSSNVAYYAALALLYRGFGYSLFAAKWLRLGIHFLSLSAVAILFRRWLGPGRALLPLLVVGLSPCWLYLNTNQGQFGMDLQFLPLFLLACFLFPWRPTWKLPMASFLFGLSWITAAMVYPTMLLYSPSVGGLLAWRWGRFPERARGPWILTTLGAGLAGAALPVLASLLFVRDPHLLIFDPLTHAGLFRGGGGGFTLDLDRVRFAIVTVFFDLYYGGVSYSFDIPNGEFSTLLARAANGIVLLGIVAYPALARRSPRNWLREPNSALFLWLLSSLLFFFFVPQFIAAVPGFRRATGFLFAYYGLIVLFWSFACTEPPALPRWLRLLFLAGLCAAVASNALVDAKNLAEAPLYATKHNFSWFTVRENPEESLLYWEQLTRMGGALRCGEQFNFTTCRYAEIYGAIQGYRRWNHLPLLPVMGWDPITKQNRAIDISLWEDHVWPQE